MAGYRQATLIGATTLAITVVATAIALCTALAILLFWRPTAGGWFTVLAGFTAIALTYGALGLLLGVGLARAAARSARPDQSSSASGRGPAPGNPSGRTPTAVAHHSRGSRSETHPPDDASRGPARPA